MTIGCALCFRLGTYQKQNCRRAIGVTRFIYSIGVATEVFRHAKPAWRGHPGGTSTRSSARASLRTTRSARKSRVGGQEGASMNFGTAMKIWPNPIHPAGPPRLKKENRAGAGSFRAV